MEKAGGIKGWKEWEGGGCGEGGKVEWRWEWIIIVGKSTMRDKWRVGFDWGGGIGYKGDGGWGESVKEWDW